MNVCMYIVHIRMHVNMHICLRVYMNVYLYVTYVVYLYILTYSPSLELVDWKANRAYRLLAVDQGFLSFTDER